MNNEYDVVIIGSGAGGGTVAARLAPLCEKGARILLLEAGPRYPVTYYTQRELEMMDLFAMAGAWPVKTGEITLAQGKGLGGSTLMYTGVTFRIQDAVLQKWNVPGLTEKDLAPRFDALEKEVNAKFIEEDKINRNNRLFQKGCRELNLPVEKFHLNIKDCEGDGFCNLGCRKEAKQGTMQVQIPYAMQAGVEVVPNCEALHVEKGMIRARVKKAPPGTIPGNWDPGIYHIRTKYTVLAGGCPGSPGLLLQSGFGKEFPALGRYITMHPAMTLYGIHPETVNGFEGFPKTYYTPAFSEKEGFFLETAFYYPFITTKHIGLWGNELADVMNAYTRLMAILVLQHDSALYENRIIAHPKKPVVIDYKLTEESIQSLCQAQVRASEIFFAAGCEKVVMPQADKKVFTIQDVPGGDLEGFIRRENFVSITTPVSSAHPQGGCRMGKNPDDSVTNFRGEVHGNPWLFVADASLFPESSHVNPYLTVMALADRVAESVTEHL